ncbi:MAG: hypothetical protein K6F14_01455 [Clostridiales bacterium]|nr:hypothetical protein [Clostridiales bacterium]
MKSRLRIFLDIAMTVLMPLLMAYSLVGETAHEIIGSVIFILFIVHHILNRKWYGAVCKGRYTPRRIFQTVLNTALFVFMILQPVSGILLSKHLYTFIPILPVTAALRSVHMIVPYWGYVLLSVHAGTHLLPLMSKMKKAPLPQVLFCADILISGYGVYAFIKRGFPGYMSGSTMFAFFNAGEPLVPFFLDYIAVMVLFASLGTLTAYLLHKFTKTR